MVQTEFDDLVVKVIVPLKMYFNQFALPVSTFYFTFQCGVSKKIDTPHLLYIRVHTIYLSVCLWKWTLLSCTTHTIVWLKLKYKFGYFSLFLLCKFFSKSFQKSYQMNKFLNLFHREASKLLSWNCNYRQIERTRRPVSQDHSSSQTFNNIQSISSNGMSCGAS